MGTRKDPKQTQTQNTTTDFQGAFKSYDITPEEQALQEWTPDRTLLDAGTKASFGAARQGIEEGVGGYSGITNPVLAARMKEIALQELADRESSALTAADRGYNEQGLRNKQFLATLRRPQYVQTGGSTASTGTTVQQNQGGLLSSLISGGLGLAAAFA
jgi:hypothetical protein